MQTNIGRRGVRGTWVPLIISLNLSTNEEMESKILRELRSPIPPYFEGTTFLVSSLILQYVQPEERIHLIQNCKEKEKELGIKIGRRGLRGTWVPLFYHYTVTIALVSESPINPQKVRGLYK